MRRVVVSNDILLADVAEIVRGGTRVTILTKGISMLPFIVGGRDSVELSRVDGDVEVGDILLVRLDGSNRYVLHRLVAIDGDDVVLMGDGNIEVVERSSRSSVIARVSSIVRPNATVDPNTRYQRLLAKMWRLLRPIRRYLLFVLRRIQ